MGSTHASIWIWSSWRGCGAITAELTLPHPRAIERRFVLVPLVEVWPDAEVAPGVAASKALDLLSPSEG